MSETQTPLSLRLVSSHASGQKRGFPCLPYFALRRSVSEVDPGESASDEGSPDSEADGTSLVVCPSVSKISTIA